MLHASLKERWPLSAASLKSNVTVSCPCHNLTTLVSVSPLMSVALEIQCESGTSTASARLTGAEAPTAFREATLENHRLRERDTYQTEFSLAFIVVDRLVFGV